MLFTLDTVACLGACGLAPVVVIDDKVHGLMTPESTLALLDSIKKEEKLHA
jgi:NADH-quinone oxidoreductase subunit E